MLSEIIASIYAGTFTDTNLSLRKESIVESELESLMQALQDKPEVAAKITSIDLGSNLMETIKLPNTLVALQYLDLSHGTLKSITVPEGLCQLEVINLVNNELENIDFANDLKSLEWLHLQGNLCFQSLLPDSKLYQNLYSLLVSSTKLLVIFSDVPYNLPQLSADQLQQKLLNDPLPDAADPYKLDSYQLKLLALKGRVDDSSVKKMFIDRLREAQTIHLQPSEKRQKTSHTNTIS